MFRRIPRPAAGRLFKPTLTVLERRDVPCSYPPAPVVDPMPVPYGPPAPPPAVVAEPVPYSREFDYHSVTVSLSLPEPLNFVGGSVTVTEDRFGEWYVGGSGGVGKSVAALPVSVNLMAGQLDQANDPSPEDLKSFIAGKSGNVTAGAVVGGGKTYSASPNAGVAHVANEVGLTTPQVSASYGNTSPLFPNSDAPPPPPVRVPTPVPTTAPAPVPNTPVAIDPSVDLTPPAGVPDPLAPRKK
jgi:hypothetical protein